MGRAGWPHGSRGPPAHTEPAPVTRNEHVPVVTCDVSRRGRHSHRGAQAGPPAAENELKEATAEQSRIRENLKVLRPEGDPYRRQPGSPTPSKRRFEQIREQIAERRKDHASRQKALEDYLVNLTVDEQT